MPQSLQKENFRLHVVGLIGNIKFQQAALVAKDLAKDFPNAFAPDYPKISGLLEFEYDTFLFQQKRTLRGETWAFTDPVIIFIDYGKLIGEEGQLEEFLHWAVKTFNWENFRPETLYQTLSQEAYGERFNREGLKHVFMEISHGENCLGEIIIELHKDKLPKTCDNFLKLCTGEVETPMGKDYKLHYKNTIFFRIVKNGWVQGGDIILGKGDGGASTFGDTFEDENYIIKHDQRGIIGMANKGRHTNQSQFYITLNSTPWMNEKYVAFGHIVEGSEVLRQIENVDTMNERPKTELKITNCGIKEFTY